MSNQHRYAPFMHSSGAEMEPKCQVQLSTLLPDIQGVKCHAPLWLWASPGLAAPLSRELISNGWTVYGLARRPVHRIPGVQPVTADLLDPASLANFDGQSLADRSKYQSGIHEINKRGAGQFPFFWPDSSATLSHTKALRGAAGGAVGKPETVGPFLPHQLS